MHTHTATAITTHNHTAIVEEVSKRGVTIKRIGSAYFLLRGEKILASSDNIDSILYLVDKFDLMPIEEVILDTLPDCLD